MLKEMDQRVRLKFYEKNSKSYIKVCDALTNCG